MNTKCRLIKFQHRRGIEREEVRENKTGKGSGEDPHLARSRKAIQTQGGVGIRKRWKRWELRLSLGPVEYKWP